MQNGFDIFALLTVSFNYILNLFFHWLSPICTCTAGLKFFLNTPGSQGISFSHLSGNPDYNYVQKNMVLAWTCNSSVYLKLKWLKLSFPTWLSMIILFSTLLWSLYLKFYKTLCIAKFCINLISFKICIVAQLF